MAIALGIIFTIDLHWDEALAAKAQEIANTCEFKHVKVHDKRWFAVGQNLHTSYLWGSNNNSIDWNGAIQSWFDEYKQYTFSTDFTKGTGHYTQVVWADTDTVGCGYASFPKDTLQQKLYVCNYGPAGNLRGHYPYVLGKSGCENLC